MWHLTQAHCDFKLWFSDGQPINAPRVQVGTSCRLIVDQLGFLDLTEIPVSTLQMMDANDEVLVVRPLLDPDPFPSKLKNKSGPIMELHLWINSADDFTLSYANARHNGATPKISGRLKSLPSISEADARYLTAKIEKKYVPYPEVEGVPGKSTEEIMALGRRLFPFTPHSFQLAMCIYDWTTASFARMVFLKIFGYTGIPSSPFPLDLNSIAEQIWESNWPPYTPQDRDYMRSFMMEPADSLDNIREQLRDVAAQLHEFSNVENRLLSAAIQSLPRTSIFEHQQLFSGQVDIYQLGLDHFGLEFLECPLNKGPVGKELKMSFTDVLSTYVSSGKIITTKMVWSFTDSVKDAMHYSNGIVLVANLPPFACVWERAAYVTPLSNEADKTEFTFMAGTQFEVQSVYGTIVDGKKIVVIELVAPTATVPKASKVLHEIKKGLPGALDGREILQQVRSSSSSSRKSHMNSRGRRYARCL